MTLLYSQLILFLPTLVFAMSKPIEVPQFIGMLVLPLIFGIFSMISILRWRARKSFVSFDFGFLSWLIFVVTAFIGDIISHQLIPSLYRSIGDNPKQMAGWSTAVVLSLLLNPITWFYYRRKSRVHNIAKKD